MSDQPAEPHEQEVPTTKERWIYGGIRVLDDKRIHAWIDPASTASTAPTSLARSTAGNADTCPPPSPSVRLGPVIGGRLGLGTATHS